MNNFIDYKFPGKLCKECGHNPSVALALFMNCEGGKFQLTCSSPEMEIIPTLFQFFTSNKLNFDAKKDSRVKITNFQVQD